MPDNYGIRLTFKSGKKLWVRKAVFDPGMGGGVLELQLRTRPTRYLTDVSRALACTDHATRIHNFYSVEPEGYAKLEVVSLKKRVPKYTMELFLAIEAFPDDAPTTVLFSTREEATNFLIKHVVSACSRTGYTDSKEGVATMKSMALDMLQHSGTYSIEDLSAEYKKLWGVSLHVQALLVNDTIQTYIRRNQKDVVKP